MPREKTATGRISSLAASTENAVGSLDCRKARTVSLTVRVTYNDSATSGVRLNAYYSPDGKHFDTIPYLYFDADFSAGSTIQETHVCDFPEHGYMDIRVENLDGTYTATQVFVFDTVVRRPEQLNGKHPIRDVSHKPEPEKKEE